MRKLLRFLYEYFLVFAPTEANVPLVMAMEMEKLFFFFFSFYLSFFLPCKLFKIFIEKRYLKLFVVVVAASAA